MSTLTTIAAKLTRIYLIVAVSVLLVTGLVAQTYLYYHTRTMAHENLGTQAAAMAGNLESAVAFGDADFAQQTLNALQGYPDVLMAAVILPDGKYLARHGLDGKAGGEDVLRASLSSGDFMAVGTHGIVRPIALPGEAPAHLVVIASLEKLNREMLLIFITGFIIGVMIQLAAYRMFRRLSRGITRPIEELTTVMRKVEQGDYTLRAKIASDDEIGELAEGFNAMLAAMEINNARLKAELDERRLAEEQLRIAAAAFESQEGMVVTDAFHVILRVNRAYTEITGFAPEDVIGKTPHLLQGELYWPLWESIRRTGGWQGEVWDRRKNGESYPTRLTISLVKGEAGEVTHYIWAHFDTTERKNAEEKIREMAFHDQLTGLPNRALLLDRLRQAMTDSVRNNGHAALLLIDLDNFKMINDTLGHEMGDLLLKQVAQRLGDQIRTGDTVARLGGDEFAVMLSGLSANGTEAASQAEVVGEKVLNALNQPYRLGQNMVHSSTSIGITLFLGRQTEAETLLKQADLALYKSKEAGRNVLHFFDPSMEVVVMKRATLENDLREAVHSQQFLLHYQAQIAGGVVTGAEVLVRWQHPQRGMVPPGDFIPLAEETGLILPLGNWVMETACAQLAAWSGKPEMEHLTLAVNVSAHQFRQPDFVKQTLAIIDRTGANPQRLKLELTESLLVSNIGEIVEKMFALKAKGVGFSLDDFGTGYSSLSYLKRLPLDQLKIDQSFVRDVLIDPNDAAIAKTIIALADSLGLGVIAEGVETEAQRDFLAGAGCHAYQGYLFSRPLPLQEYEGFVAGR